MFDLFPCVGVNVQVCKRCVVFDSEDVVGVGQLFSRDGHESVWSV